MTTEGPISSAPRRWARQDVIDAAVTITAAHGLAAVSISAVADALGVRRPSIYHHMPGGVEELRTAVVARIAEMVRAEPDDEPSPHRVWEGLERSLRDIDKMARRYPGVVQHILTTGRDEPLSLEGAAAAVDLLVGSELRISTPEAYLILHAFVTGWAYAQRPSADAATAQGFGRLGQVLKDADALDGEHILLVGLRVLLSGLLSREPDQPPPTSRSAPRS
ncbi:MAG: hypothetical protein JWL64_2562 [Frankiales bacterium]|nr:hypothetical protein [Frankiales bacterium]